MIVEFVGCSGTGKTRLRRSVYERLVDLGKPVRVPLELFIGQRMAGRIESERIRNVLLDILVFPWFWIGLRKHRDFLVFAFELLRKKKRPFMRPLLLLRSVIRKLGIHTFCSRRRCWDLIVLVDEGTVHIAHLLLVSGTEEVEWDSVRRFARIVPCPDHVVYVTASFPLIEQRTLARSDQPIKEVSRDELSLFLQEALEIFSWIFGEALVPAPVIQVENLGTSTGTLQADTEKVIRHVTASF